MIIRRRKQWLRGWKKRSGQEYEIIDLDTGEIIPLVKEIDTTTGRYVVLVDCGGDPAEPTERVEDERQGNLAAVHIDNRLEPLALIKSMRIAEPKWYANAEDRKAFLYAFDAILVPEQPGDNSERPLHRMPMPDYELWTAASELLSFVEGYGWDNEDPDVHPAIKALRSAVDKRRAEWIETDAFWTDESEDAKR